MKVVVWFVIFSVLYACSCPDETEVANLRQQNDSLIFQKNQADSIMNTVLSAYGNIDSNLAVIEQKKAIINSMARKGKLTKAEKKRILAEMDSINFLLELNRNTVSELEGSLADKKERAPGITQVLQGLNDKNTYKADQVVDMKKDLAQISRDFSDLFEEYVYKEAENLEMREKLSSAAELLESTKEKLYSAWYVIGTKAELKEKGIVYNTGLFVNKAVNEDFDKSQFRKINIHELKEIILDSRKAEIITTHPTESYQMVGMKKKVNKMVITDPEAFWSVSKFLIIEVEN